jgi:hypothetical protein
MNKNSKEKFNLTVRARRSEKTAERFQRNRGNGVNRQGKPRGD